MEKTTENTPRDEKTKHLRDGASVLSIMFFWWMNDVLRLGNKRPLTDEDLFPILGDYKSEVLVEKAENCWWDEINKRKLNNAKPRLWKVMFRLIPFKSAVVMIMLKLVASIAFALLPLCLWLVLKTLNDGSNLDMKFAFMYVAFLGITSIVRAVSIQHFNNASELWGVKLKVALIGLVYKKVLSLNRYSLEATLSGNTINLVSNDAQKIEKFLHELGYVLTAPVELVISLTILVYLIGWRALVGAAFFFALVAFQMLMGTKAAKLRGKAAKFTDQRLVVMNEIISGIRAVKMYAWEWNFRDIVCNLRRKEMAMIRLKGLIFSMLVILYFTTLPIAALITVTTLVLTGQHLSSFEIFTVLLGIMTIRSAFCYSLGIAVQIVADGKVALDRIQTFLMENPSHVEVTKNQLSTTEQFKNEMGVQLTSYRERVDSVDVNSQTLTSNSTPITNSKLLSFEVPLKILEEPLSTRSITSQTGVSSSKEPYLSISDASYSWNQDLLTEELSGITFNVCNGDMLAITGAVGSGKSSLLTAILGELPLSKGEISYRGKMAYVPQIPWVFSGTIRENILFGLPYKEAKFQHVVDICGLTKDLAVFNNGDLTEIGQRGVTLSGGQKARVGLARAVYSDADIYLLDDPLSAVDTKVGRALFESCILGRLSSRICLLVTHQLQYLKDVDCIAVMEKGSIVHLGKYTELKDKAVFSDILELSQHFEDVPERIRSVSLCEFNKKGNIVHRPRSATSVSHVKGQELPLELLHKLPEGDGPTERSGLDEFNDDGNMKNVTYRSSHSPVSLMSKTEGRDNEAFDNLEFSKLPGEESVEVIHVNNETTLQTAGSLVLHSTFDVPETDYRPVLDLKEEEESKRAGTVTWRHYWDYFKEGLPVPFIILLAVLLIVAQVCLIAPSWWLSRMADMSHDQQKAPDTHIIHGSLVAVSIVVMIASSFALYHFLLKSAENLHNKMTATIIKAPVLFFDKNPAGRILNRFSKDVGSMDDVLPPVFIQMSILSLISLCALLVPAVTNYWLFLALLPMIGIFVYYGRYYLKSSRELKRIEATKCSPVYSHITETVNGLEIVHTSKMSKTFLERLHRYQNENTQAFFMLVSCSRWMGFRLDVLSSVFVTIVAVAAILVIENPALAGFALTYALQALDLMQVSVRFASEVENVMTSVERVMTYTEIDSEPGYSTETRPSGSWPKEGNLAIQDLSLVYFEGGPRILNDINFSVGSKEKVGVVGRTGAGKSSLVSALFRMPDPLGKVLIDGVDIRAINIQEARRSMAVITQDPVLFGGTLKRNIDPFSQYTDQDLWTALGEVQLKDIVENLPGQLEFKLKESGTNLSVGERQLVCLARALVQKSKIIVMDEATANVDFKTDRLIQEVIRNKFKDSTVLTIAHRLNTIMDYDKVLVLDGGRVVEFDKPEVLIRNDGLFAEMVRSQS